MQRKINRKSNKKNNNMQLYRQPNNFLGRTYKRACSVQQTVYAVRTALAFQSYTFDSSVSQTSATQYLNINSVLINSTEFAANTPLYSLFKIDSISIKVVNAQNYNLANTFTALPTYALDVVPPYTNLYITSAYNSDTNMVISPNNTSIMSRTYTLPSSLQSGLGYPMGGTGSWLATQGFAGSANSLFIILGFSATPVATATGIIPIAELDINVNVTFAKGVKLQ